MLKTIWPLTGAFNQPKNKEMKTKPKLRFEVRRCSHVQRLQSGRTMSTRVWAVYDTLDNSFVKDTEDTESEIVQEWASEMEADCQQQYGGVTPSDIEQLRDALRKLISYAPKSNMTAMDVHFVRGIQETIKHLI